MTDYVAREYGKEFPIVRGIVARTLGEQLMRLEEPAVEAMVRQIVGYYTGCLRPDGTPRRGVA